MKRTSLFLTALIALAALPALSQQLQQPTVPTTRPVKPPANSGIGPRLDQPQPTQAPKLISNPNQRPQTPNVIPSTGPAQEVPTGPAAPGAQKKPAKVLDPGGRPVDGMIQVAPNRVYDPATGKYHWTENSGQEQKLLND